MNEKSVRLGAIGENLYSNVKNSLGHNVQIALDPYNSNRDMEVDGKTVEVKTQQRLRKLDRFTINKNQLRKCSNVDILVIVETPFNGSPVRVYEYYPKTSLVFSKRTVSMGRVDKYTIRPIDGNLIYETDDLDIKSLLCRYTETKY